MPIDVQLQWNGPQTEQVINAAFQDGLNAVGVTWSNRIRASLSKPGVPRGLSTFKSILRGLEALGEGRRRETARSKAELTSIKRAERVRDAGGLSSRPQSAGFAGEPPRTRTGTLRRSIGFWRVTKDSVAIGADMEAAPYARIQEFGGIIRPKKGPWLVFQILPGVWRRAKSVYIPPRPYLRPAIRSGREDAVRAFVNAVQRRMKRGL